MHCSGLCMFFRQDLRRRFPAKQWLDVLSKADLLADVCRPRLPATGHRTDVDDSCSSATASRDLHVLHQLEGQLGTSPALGDAGAHRASRSLSSSNSDTLHAPVSSADTAASSGINAKQSGWDTADASGSASAAEVAGQLPGAMWVSSITQDGLGQLKRAVVAMLAPESLARTNA